MRNVHLHLHFEGSLTPKGYSSRRSMRRILAMVMDVGFYILMAAAVMSSLCLFICLYTADIDPDAGTYRAQLMHYTPKIKRLFRRSNEIDDMVRELNKLDRTVGVESSFKNTTSQRSSKHFREFVTHLQNFSVPVVLYKKRFNEQDLKNSFSCGGSNVVKLLSYRTLHGNQLAADKLDKELPEDNPLPDKAFHRCAVVGNSGEIDEHDAVLRFNAAKIAGFEQFVGSKTTIRLLNSPDASWPKDGTEATIMTIRNHEAIREWQKAYDRDRMGGGPAYITDPEFLCHTWDWVQQTGEKPSSGLVGVVMAMKLCDQVHLYGFQSSNYFGRFSRPHYYDWERPQKGREKVHPFQRELTLYKQLESMGFLKFRDSEHADK
eukprot:CAMPEP_0177754128 /NCGR_PEP_ID=MMETSP0491_2-20121128/1840_1 /TAXON_ID=63592 /ORGANISM="Tetraselmis chuii, Strain PLY429" /LENGTH=375 /DNA_ID=CAMNT_0019269483 /DNA_START=115 /DNA_END=1242 /DNA_ORIENTATION=-